MTMSIRYTYQDGSRVMTKECDWCGRDIATEMVDSFGDAKLGFVGRGRTSELHVDVVAQTFEFCSTKCMIEAARRQFYGS